MLDPIYSIYRYTIYTWNGFNIDRYMRVVYNVCLNNITKLQMIVAFLG
jgi:hypothetical protein